MPSTPSPCILNSPPPPSKGLLQFITYGGGWGSEDLGVSRGFQGGRKGRDKLSLTECKGGDRRDLTAGERGGVCQNITEPGGGEQVNLNQISPTVSPPR